MGYGSKVKTLKDIGTEWSVSRERIRQIESKAIKKLEFVSDEKDIVYNLLCNI